MSLNRIEEINMTCKHSEGMKIESVTLKMLKNKIHSMIVTFSEEGFVEHWHTRIFLSSKQIEFTQAHHIVRKFFNEKAQEYIFKKVIAYEAQLDRQLLQMRRKNRML